jgi:aspartate/methionine/tyrosine aminotransferase
VVSVHPNNPTGAYTDPWIAQACAEAGTALIADEVFYPFQLTETAREPLINDCRHSARSRRIHLTGIDPATGAQDDREVANNQWFPSDQPQRLSGDDTALTFGLDGLSKLLAAPQLKLGWIRLSGPYSLRRQAERALDEIADTYLSVNSPVALALPELLTLADSTIARVTARLTANLATAREVFTDLRVRTTYGGWMMLLDVPPILTPDDLGIALMNRAGIYVHPGYFYDLPDSTLALSLLPEEPVFREACLRLAAGLDVLKSEV